MSLENLKSKSGKEIIAYLQGVEFKKDPMEATPEGLGRLLEAAVEGDPEKFIDVVDEFKKEIDCTYVSHFFSGLRESFKKKSYFKWEPVLSLAEWVVGQPRDSGSRYGYWADRHDADKDWRNSRKYIADLLTHGFKEGEGELPLELKDLVRDILLPLTGC